MFSPIHILRKRVHMSWRKEGGPKTSRSLGFSVVRGVTMFESVHHRHEFVVEQIPELVHGEMEAVLPTQGCLVVFLDDDLALNPDFILNFSSCPIPGEYTLFVRPFSCRSSPYVFPWVSFHVSHSSMMGEMEALTASAVRRNVTRSRCILFERKFLKQR